MAATKLERLVEIMRRLKKVAPFSDGAHARLALEEIMRAVEDEYSGVPENPDAANAQMPDGRMYPPHDKYERTSDCAHVRLFAQARHRTFFGDNGALRIVRSDGTLEIDLHGTDGKNIDDLFSESQK